MTVSLSRILLFAPTDAAEHIAAVLARVAGTEPSVAPFTRSDGTLATGRTVTFADAATVQVVEGTSALPAVLELVVPDLPAAACRAAAEVAGEDAASVTAGDLRIMLRAV